jgi:uncharacterized protein (TIGR00251 family)
MPPPAFLRAKGPDTLLFVKVTPRAPRNEIGEPLGAELKIKIAAPPVESAANQELLVFLASQLGCGRGAIQIVRGGASRHKTLQIAGLSAEETARRLGLKVKWRVASGEWRAGNPLRL